MYKHTDQRTSKYCDSIEFAMKNLGHATNAEVLEVLRKTYPTLSATTVHRATARLATRGVLGVAPSTKDGVMRYDSNVEPHDHFQCVECDVLKDTQIKDQVVPILESSIDGCRISGQITVSGVCKKCKRESQL